MTTETNPGRWRSERGGFYFSCDTGDGVLVGVKDPSNGSTCPIIGIDGFRTEWESEKDAELLSILQNGSELLYGGTGQFQQILKVPFGLWERITGEQIALDSWHEPDCGYVIAVLSEVGLFRLSLGFE